MKFEHHNPIPASCLINSLVYQRQERGEHMSAIDLKRLVFFLIPIFGLVSKNEKNGAKNNSSHSSEKKQQGNQ